MAPATPGELNYALTKVCDRYLVANGVSYSRVNDCVGSLERLKLRSIGVSIVDPPSLLDDYLEEIVVSGLTERDILGAIEGAKAELQRRVLTPYEDQKIAENGDVYECLLREVDE